MAIIARSEGESNFSPIPEGVHTAICFGIVDIGMQYSDKFDRTARKVIIMWELPDEIYKSEDGEEPRILSKEYTLSLSEKATLRKDLQAWRGKVFTDEELKGFDLVNILGKGCQIQIIHRENNGKTYANIASIMGLPKGMKVDEPAHEKMYFDMEDPACLDMMHKLPEWIQDRVRASETYSSLAVDGLPEDDDELPF